MDIQFSVSTKVTVSGTLRVAANNLPTAGLRFGLDRDQIFYSRAFRRLAGKTQLMAAGKNEILRTRLTHTLEVSQIARAIGQALGLDLDLIEAIVLGHDLGHTPFGHVGERTLHEIMTPDEKHLLGKRCLLCRPADEVPAEWLPYLGFKHNLQGLVVAMELEKNETGRGLGLTEYTLYGIQAHTKPEYKPSRMKNAKMLGYYRKYLETGCKIDDQWAWSLEALLVGQADEIAQWHHDLEDALLEGMIAPADMVEAMKPMLQCGGRALTPAEQNVLDHPENYPLESFTYVCTHILVETLMDKLVEAAAENIRKLGGAVEQAVPARNTGHNSKVAHIFAKKPSEEELKDIFSYGDKDVEGSFAEAVEAFPEQIGGILGEKSIRKADLEGEKILKKLFCAYYRKPEKLPDSCVFDFLGACYELEHTSGREEYEHKLREDFALYGMAPIRQLYQKKLKSRSKYAKLMKLVLMRTICNHIASMTDADARRAAKKI